MSCIVAVYSLLQHGVGLGQFTVIHGGVRHRLVRPGLQLEPVFQISQHAAGGKHLRSRIGQGRRAVLISLRQEIDPFCEHCLGFLAKFRITGRRSLFYFVHLELDRGDFLACKDAGIFECIREFGDVYIDPVIIAQSLQNGVAGSQLQASLGELQGGLVVLVVGTALRKPGITVRQFCLRLGVEVGIVSGQKDLQLIQDLPGFGNTVRRCLYIKLFLQVGDSLLLLEFLPALGNVILCILQGCQIGGEALAAGNIFFGSIEAVGIECCLHLVYIKLGDGFACRLQVTGNGRVFILKTIHFPYLRQQLALPLGIVRFGGIQFLSYDCLVIGDYVGNSLPAF